MAVKKRIRHRVKPKEKAEVHSHTGETIPAYMDKVQNTKYTVITSFRSITDFNKQYLPGDDVSHFDRERLDKLVLLRYVKEDD